MTGLVYAPRFPQTSWWFYGIALGVAAGLGAVGWLTASGAPPLLAWAFYAAAVLVAAITMVRILRGLRVIPLVRGKATRGGYRLTSTFPVTMSAWDFTAKDGSRTIPAGSVVSIVERINRLGDDFYLGPTLYIYEALAAQGNFRFFNEGRLGSRDFDDLARALAEHDISLVLLIETGPDAGRPPVHRIEPESPYTRWVALPRRAGVITAGARDGASIPSMWTLPAGRTADSVQFATHSHRPLVFTVAHAPPLSPEAWQLVGTGVQGRYADTLMLWTETGGVQCHADVPGGFTSFSVVTTMAQGVQYVHVHLDGHP